MKRKRSKNPPMEKLLRYRGFCAEPIPWGGHYHVTIPLTREIVFSGTEAQIRAWMQRKSRQP